MNILVTGGAGYIGTHLVKKLLLLGHSVSVLDNFSRGFWEPLQILKKYGNLKVFNADLRNPKELEKVFSPNKFDAVVHMAGVCSVSESMQNPQMYFENNFVGTLNLLNAMNKYKIKRIVFSSTCAVYSKPEYLPVDESHPALPLSPYGESKLMAENLIKWFGQIHKFNYVILRFFNVCGTDPAGEIGDGRKPTQALVSSLTRGVLGIEQAKITCGVLKTKDGTAVRDYVDVLDISSACVKALDKLKSGKSGLVNIGSGRGYSVKDVIAVVNNELGSNLGPKKGTKRIGETPELWADIKLAKNFLGWMPEKSIAESIRSTALWYEANPDGYRK